MKAYLFPGQGSQKVGMGKDHYSSDPQFKSYVDKADQILGYSLSSLMFEGPGEELTQTQHTQPAIFVHSYALYRVLDEKPDMVAGHSLGEFTALAAADVLHFEDALKLVSKRGELMQNAGEVNPGTMAAIIGMDDEIVDQICVEASKEAGKPVVPANYNSPGQLVISGAVEAVEKAVELAKEKGCRIAKMLPVSGAFHSPLMKHVFDEFSNALNEVEFNDPQFPVYSNVTGKPVINRNALKENVLNQLVSPVKWTQTLKNMQANKADTFVEVGPGKVLQGLVKRTLENISIEGHE
ncbi:MAG TPA: ACP S-malonyltransferase [Balneolaceae bacterium]|nr:ACP S-malonyltransferase [Balneolaceae bacterium]